MRATMSLAESYKLAISGLDFARIPVVPWRQKRSHQSSNSNPPSRGSTKSDMDPNAAEPSLSEEVEASVDDSDNDASLDSLPAPKFGYDNNPPVGPGVGKDIGTPDQDGSHHVVKCAYYLGEV